MPKLNPGPRGPDRTVTTAPKKQSSAQYSQRYTNTAAARPSFEEAANLQKGELTLENVKNRRSPPNAGYTQIKTLKR